MKNYIENSIKKILPEKIKTIQAKVQFANKYKQNRAHPGHHSGDSFC